VRFGSDGPGNSLPVKHELHLLVTENILCRCLYRRHLAGGFSSGRESEKSRQFVLPASAQAGVIRISNYGLLKIFLWRRVS